MAPSRTRPSGRSKARIPRPRWLPRSAWSSAARCRGPSSRRAPRSRRSPCARRRPRTSRRSRGPSAASTRILSARPSRAALRPGARPPRREASRRCRRRAPGRSAKHIAPPISTLSAISRNRLEDTDLVRHLGAAEDHDQRALGIVAERCQARRARARAGGPRTPEGGGRRPRSSRGRDGRRRRRRSRRGRPAPPAPAARSGSFSCLPLLPAAVLEQEHLAWLERLGLRDDLVAHHSGRERRPARSGAWPGGRAPGASRARHGSRGRPRCETRTTFASCLSRSWTVGSAALIRVSSVISPSASGTLRSARTRTRLPSAGASRTLRNLCDKPGVYPRTLVASSTTRFE